MENIANKMLYMSEPTGFEGIILKTGASGIDARDDSGSSPVAGKAEDCIRVFIKTDGTIKEDSSITYTVYNPFSSAVGESVYILCKKIAGIWVVDSEDCGG
jgi:hypothetical protein